MELSASAQRVQEALSSLGLALQVVALPASSRTAAEAAEAIGCELGQIAKTLVFRTRDASQPLVVIASGTNRVDESILAGWLGEAVTKADADYVRLHTGFSIGGVAPCGYPHPIETIIDVDLLRFGEIWAAAGTAHAVFRLTPQELRIISWGTVMAIHH